MTDRLLAFDLETAKVLPAGQVDLMRHRPLGIACAAAAPSDREEPVIWHGGSSPEPAARMSQSEVSALVDDLVRFAEEGYTLVSWNGLAFDFDVLAEESGRFQECAELALAHVDMMFQAVCVLGHRIALAKVAEGMGLPGKEGISGAEAPVLWAAGQHEKVLNYVTRDARLTLYVALEAQRLGSLAWITQRGSRRSMPLDGGWLSVEECRELPLPDTSWMDDPPSRAGFTRWMHL